MEGRGHASGFQEESSARLLSRCHATARRAQSGKARLLPATQGQNNRTINITWQNGESPCSPRFAAVTVWGRIPVPVTRIIFQPRLMKRIVPILAISGVLARAEGLIDHAQSDPRAAFSFDAA